MKYFKEYMEKTLVLVKPAGVARGLIGEVIKRFEQKGLQVVGLKLMQLADEVIAEHYAHLVHKPFFGEIKKSMQSTPVVALCLKSVDAVEVVRAMTGVTNGRNALPGTVRGDLCVSVLYNIIHASDTREAAAVEINRFFKPEEILDYENPLIAFLYASDELV